MSGHGQHDDHADDHAGHDDHHETSSDDFPADEPRSPGWLPLLGGALLLAGIFGYMVLTSDDKNADSANAEAAPAPTDGARAQSARRPAVALPPDAELPANHPRPAGD